MNDDETNNWSSQELEAGPPEEEGSVQTRVMFHVEHWPQSLQDYATALEDGLDAFLERVERGSIRLARLSQLKVWDVMSELVTDACQSDPNPDVQARERRLDHVDRITPLGHTSPQLPKTTKEKQLTAALLRPQTRVSSFPRRRRMRRGRR